MLSYIINAMLRGAGEARLPMCVLLLATGTTVLLEPALIFGRVIISWSLGAHGRPGNGDGAARNRKLAVAVSTGSE